MNRIIGALLATTVLIAAADAQIYRPGGSSSGGSFPPSGCSTANGVIFNNATPCDSGFTYAGSGGPLTSNGAIFGGAAAAQFQFGAANVNGAPVAQTLSFQGALAGSATNQASANTTIIGSLGTGTGTNGDIIFQTGVKTTTGTAQATATTALTIKGETGQLQVLNGTLSSPSITGSSISNGIYFSAGVSIGYVFNNALRMFMTGTNIDVANTTSLGFESGGTGTSDTFISRSGAGVINIGTTGTNAGGTVNAASYEVGGVAGLASKTCTINTANVTTGITLTITGGIITATTTC